MTIDEIKKIVGLEEYSNELLNMFAALALSKALKMQIRTVPTKGLNRDIHRAMDSLAKETERFSKTVSREIPKYVFDSKPFMEDKGTFAFSMIHYCIFFDEDTQEQMLDIMEAIVKKQVEVQYIKKEEASDGGD